MGAGEIGAFMGPLVGIAFFGMIGAIAVAPRYFRHKEREQLQETLRAAYERGQPVAPELIEAMQTGPKPIKPIYGPERDLRRGIFWMAWAAAFLAAGGLEYYYDPSNDSTGTLMGVAAFPGFIGIAYLAIWVLTRSKKTEA
jgi:hypothetical protein